MERELLENKRSLRQVYAKTLLDIFYFLHVFYELRLDPVGDVLEELDRLEKLKLDLLNGLLHSLCEQLPLLFAQVHGLNLTLLQVHFVESIMGFDEPFDLLFLDLVLELVVLLVILKYLEEEEVVLS